MVSESGQEIRIRNHPESLRQIRRLLDELAESAHLSPAQTRHLDLAIEEHAANVFEHGFQNSRSAELLIRARTFPDHVAIELVDDGPEFNLLNHPPVDTSIPLDKKAIGGLGIHMIRKSVDDIRYERLSGANKVTLIVKGSASAPSE